jgi:predicted transcriptional regulator
VTYVKSYTAWADYPATTTPVTAPKLQNIDDGIYTTAVTATAALTAAAALSAANVSQDTSIAALSAATVALTAANVSQDVTIAAVSAVAYAASRNLGVIMAVQ